MKKYLPLFIFIMILAGCGGSKNYLERNDEDKALQDAVRRLNKSQKDENASNAVPVLYSSLQKNHLAKIKSYSTGSDLARWDRIINEYNALQNAYDVIINSTAAFRLITPQNYSTELLETKEHAADENYVLAKSWQQKEGRDDARQAYNYFRKADRLVPGYKDAAAQMDVAYQSAIVNVIINPIQDNSYFSNSGWGSGGYNYSNDYFQQTLTRELQNENSGGRYAARFYSDWQARRDNIQPDWLVDLRLRDIDIPYPAIYTYKRTVNAQVKNGIDTAGKTIYQMVYATLNITRQSFVARAGMDVNITDLQTRKAISHRSFSEDYKWQEERGSYSGDSRALSSNDWAILNNNNYNAPRREEILGELFRKIYPQVKNNIGYAVAW